MLQSAHGAARHISARTMEELFELAQAYDSEPAHRLYLVREAVCLLGDLSPWWLAPDALDLVANSCPDPRYRDYARLARSAEPEPGLALVTCVWKECGASPAGADHWGLLRHGAVLPVRWYAGRSHDETLPQRLLELADAVLEEFATEKGWPTDGCPLDEFGLGWASALSGKIDARSLPMEAESAFFALAAALYLARHAPQAPSNPKIWVSAAWDPNDRYVRRVDGIRYKVATALQFGAKTIFVPPGNLHEARKAVQDLSADASPDVVRSVPTQNTFAATLKPILVQYRVRPPANAPFDELKAYHLYIAPLDRRQCKEFHASHLFPHIVKKCVEQLPPDLRELAERRPVLVAPVSHSEDLIRLAWRVFNCRKLVAVLIGGKDTPAARQGLERLKNWDIPEPCLFEFPERGWPETCARARELYEQVLRELDGPVLVDLTPGFKVVSLALLLARPAGNLPETHYVYLSHDWLPLSGVREPAPGSQRYERVDPGQAPLFRA